MSDRRCTLGNAGIYQLAGKGAFDREMEDDAFEPDPEIFVTRLIEEDNIVVAEGKVLSKEKMAVRWKPPFAMYFIWKEVRSGNSPII
ncbi:hypothetical protein [Chitinophaga pinensis]|uniref:hypothetical protein n=1 Tax=Chitinophaga pinensis TaxID=79329 RepID=UPI001C993083|nr:hypothetical protein [Chitinophaga pinensis]